MYKQKLIDLLKSDEQTKEAMEKLEFGNYIIIHGTHCKVIEFNGSNLKIYNGKRYLNYKYPEHIWGNSQDKSNLEIIGLPLSERFIRMYLKNILNDFNLYKANFIYQKIYIEIDNTKDFDNQEDIVYQRIYEVLL